MDKNKHITAIFHQKRSAMIDDLKCKLHIAQQTYEDLCENSMPTREKTIVYLVEKEILNMGPLTDAVEECGCRLEVVHNEFDLFHEVGKNSIVAVIIQASESVSPESTIASLVKRKIPTFVVQKDKRSGMDKWLKAFGSFYSWPNEMERLVLDIKPLCDC